jgi:hypothetical protein
MTRIAGASTVAPLKEAAESEQRETAMRLRLQVFMGRIVFLVLFMKLDSPLLWPPSECARATEQLEMPIKKRNHASVRPNHCAEQGYPASLYHVLLSISITISNMSCTVQRGIT